jgi:hypothetical protein
LRGFLVFVLVALAVAAGVGGYFWYSMEKPFGRIPPEGVFV